MSGRLSLAAPCSRRRSIGHCSLFLLGVWAQGHAAAQASAQPGASVPTILVVGDSLSAEYGIARGSGWVALLERRLKAEGRRDRVINASISGDTTAGGRSRLPALLTQHQPQVVVIELGGNDALRGLPIASTRENLTAMVKAAQSASAKVLLVGMQVPPNYGKAYTDAFSGVFSEVGRTTRAAVVPFLLKGVADGPKAEELFQADRIHPKEAAHPIMLDNVWPALKGLLPR